MILALLAIGGGLALLPLGAEGFVRGGAGLALRLGLTPLAVGLTVVAFGTSSPELFLNVQAAAAGNSGIALGNVVGSNIANIALVLGVAALVRPMHARSELIKREMPLMIGVTLVLCAMLLDGTLSRPEGAMLVTGSVAYGALTYFIAKRGESEQIDAEFDEALTEPSHAAWRDVALLAGGLIALPTGTYLLLNGAVTIANSFGVSQVVIGLTVVAIGTSLPELATSVVASHRREADIALGNVVGSNIFNILAILGVTALIRPFTVEGLRTLDVGVMIGVAVLLWQLLWRGAILDRRKGLTLVAGYAVYVVTLLP